MKTRYDVKDIVYYVRDYHIVKGTITEVIIKKDVRSTDVIYKVVSITNGKEFQCVEAQLVDTLNVAKKSAKANWSRINSEVQKGFNEMTEKSFEPLAQKVPYKETK